MHNTKMLTLALTLCGLLLTGCVSSSMVEVPVPDRVVDQTVVTSKTGAQQLYVNAMGRWAAAVGGSPAFEGDNLILTSGVYTDELLRVQNSGLGNFRWRLVDTRDDGIRTGTVRVPFLDGLNAARTSAHLAREALNAYAPDTPPSWRARTLVAEGFTIVYTAEMFCSGMPLSTVSLTSGLQLTRGFTTVEMLTQAIALFDSAIAIAPDSQRFTYAASVGKGRAFLDMGKFTEASAAVTAVPTNFVFVLEFNPATLTNGNTIGEQPQYVQVRDNEGQNGLIWSNDPRSAIVTTPSISGGILVPGKYSVIGGAIDATASNPSASVRAIDGLEARLIEAEADLANGGTNWLVTLNMLRATCIGAVACAPVPGLNATNLPPTLTDPGNAAARLDLLMRERALWLYLTGHRQGDLRRLAHLYNRNPGTLWPTGLYVNPGSPPQVFAADESGQANYSQAVVLTAGAEINAPQNEETVLNPLYTGCVDKNP